MMLTDIKKPALLGNRKKKMLLSMLRETRHENSHCLLHPQLLSKFKCLQVLVEPGRGTWPFCNLIVKIWRFLAENLAENLATWPQIFCLASWCFFGIFENLAEL